jgi:hypothetical protein
MMMTCGAGKPTVHVKWDEATAVLAGDALQTLAFELLADPALGSGEVRIALVAGLARASGAEGMVLGQALDIAAETAAAPLTLASDNRIAGGQDRCADPLVGGSRGGDCGGGPCAAAAYAEKLGLAFQIWDDVLDVEGDVAKTGKRLHKDADAGKATFVSLLGLDAAKARAGALIAAAADHLGPYGDTGGELDCLCALRYQPRKLSLLHGPLEGRMTDRPKTPLLDRVTAPADLKALNDRELRQVADELRAETISAVSQTGGHLGAGLGVVELTVAIHAVFDTPRDKLIWDVGHQCYPHKILTGRRDRIRTLRTEGGLSGFTKRSESPL